MSEAAREAGGREGGRKGERGHRRRVTALVICRSLFSSPHAHASVVPPALVSATQLSANILEEQHGKKRPLAVFS